MLRGVLVLETIKNNLYIKDVKNKVETVVQPSIKSKVEYYYSRYRQHYILFKLYLDKQDIEKAGKHLSGLIKYEEYLSGNLHYLNTNLFHCFFTIKQDLLFGINRIKKYENLKNIHTFWYSC